MTEVSDDRVGIDVSGEKVATLSPPKPETPGQDAGREERAEKRSKANAKIIEADDAAVEAGILPERGMQVNKAVELAKQEVANFNMDAESIVKEDGVPYEPSEIARKLVADLKFAGLTQEEISEVINMSVPTLKKYFPYELSAAPKMQITALAESAYRRAMAGDTTMTIFLLKTLGGPSFKEKRAEDALLDKARQLPPEQRRAMLLEIAAGFRSMSLAQPEPMKTIEATVNKDS